MRVRTGRCPTCRRLRRPSVPSSEFVVSSGAADKPGKERVREEGGTPFRGFATQPAGFPGGFPGAAPQCPSWRSNFGRGALMSRARQRLGSRGELFAACSYTLRGHRIIGRRVKTPLAEVDLVCRRGRQL